MELNRQQKIAVTYDKGHVLVLAGAGTGKTRTIIARAEHLIQNKVTPNRILLLTFTRRAAKEMVDRLNQMIGRPADFLMAGTFHHFCLYTMRRMPGPFEMENATVIDRDDQIQLMKLIRGEFKKEIHNLPRAAELVNLCSYARNTNQPIADYLPRHTDFDGTTIEKICEISKAFDQRKKQNNYLDYDDILFRFAKRLHEVPAVREKLRGFYDHILVDEMQDTNPLQWLILDGLRDPARLFCVGDDAQSIYAFRGADFRNVHSFTARVPGSVVLKLEENYRSTQGILDLSNWLLCDSPLNYDKTLTARRKTVSTPQLMDFDGDFEEARWVTRDLMERHEGGAPWKDHMIITRTGYGARSVESFMVENKIPYQFVGGISLLQAAHVKDLFSLIRSCASQHDELAWARYLTLWPRIGDVTAARLIHKLRQTRTIADALKTLRGLLANRTAIIEGLETVRDAWDDPPRAILEAGRFLTPLMKKKYAANWEARLHDIKLLARLAGNHKSLLAFLETYTLDPVSSTTVERLETDDIVTLTTVHSAKGTESPVCYLIRVEPGMYPHLRSMASEEAMEEERRILYVAMTRARDELIITRTYRTGGAIGFYSSGYGGYGHQENGYFLESLDENLVELGVMTYQSVGFDDNVIHSWRE